MKYTKLIFALFLASTAAVAQETYKCNIGGSMVYQDRPCPGAARRSADMPAKSGAASPAATASPMGDAKPAAAPASDLDRNKAYLAGREKERAVADQKAKIAHLKEQITNQEESISQSQQARDSEISAIEARKARANNNLAGANLEQALATEMQSVNSRYATDIVLKQDKLRQLRDELAAAQK